METKDFVVKAHGLTTAVRIKGERGRYPHHRMILSIRDGQGNVVEELGVHAKMSWRRAKRKFAVWDEAIRSMDVFRNKDGSLHRHRGITAVEVAMVYPSSVVIQELE